MGELLAAMTFLSAFVLLGVSDSVTLYDTSGLDSNWAMASLAASAVPSVHPLPGVGPFGADQPGR